VCVRSYLFSRLLALPVDFAGPLEPTFVLLLPASTAARRVSALSGRAPQPCLMCRSALACSPLHLFRFVCTPHRVLHSIGCESTFSPLTSVEVL
jgi:hypothetical protein